MASETRDPFLKAQEDISDDALSLMGAYDTALAHLRNNEKAEAIAILGDMTRAKVGSGYPLAAQLRLVSLGAPYNDIDKAHALNIAAEIVHAMRAVNGSTPAIGPGIALALEREGPTALVMQSRRDRQRVLTQAYNEGWELEREYEFRNSLLGQRLNEVEARCADLPRFVRSHLRDFEELREAASWVSGGQWSSPEVKHWEILKALGVIVNMKRMLTSFRQGLVKVSPILLHQMDALGLKSEAEAWRNWLKDEGHTW